MGNLFLKIVDSSITASIIVLFILVLRFLFKKSTKKFSYILWLILLVKLIIPISLETTFNPMPNGFAKFSNRAYIGEDIQDKDITPNLKVKTEEMTNPNNNQIIGAPNISKTNTNKNKTTIKNTLSYIWLIGIILFLVHGLVSNRKLEKNLEESTYLYGNIYENKNLQTAFIHGIIRPKIYIPNYLDEKEREYIILHEETHLKRYDHIIKFFYYIVLAIHWFNPFIWLAFILMARDMELSCDEAVMKKLGNDEKENYCETLLALATGHKMKIVVPLSFSENNTKGRVKNVLDYKKPKFWVSLILVIVVVISAFFIFTKPKVNGEDIIGHVEDDEYGIYNKKFKDPREVADIIFNKELEKVKEYTREDVKIEEAKITKFEGLYSYEDYLDNSIEVFEFEYIIRGKELLDYPFVDISNDGALTEENLRGIGKPLLAFLNKGNKYEFLGFIFSGELYSDSKAEIEIGLNELLENRGLKGPEIFPGNHIISENKLKEGGTHKLLLSQPAKTGKGGIWCVDRWMDENGNMYYNVIPSNLSLKEYYAKLQEQVDNGENQDLLDGEKVALKFIEDHLGPSFAKTYRFKFQKNASVEDFLVKPTNQYFGYIMELVKYDWSEDYTVHFDKVEFLHDVDPGDLERLKELGVDPNRLDNGFYIYNPTSYPASFTIDEDTEFYIIKLGDTQPVKVSEDEFIKHYNENKDALYMLEDEDFKLLKVVQRYLP